jgi:hypothetical protein
MSASLAFPRLPPSRAEIYHEAGHAVWHWHRRWRFRYVTLRPRIPGHAAHLVGYRKPSTEAGYLSEMGQRAAGPIAERQFADRPMLTGDQLRQLLGQVIEGSFRDPDLARFIEMGKALDRVVDPKGGKGLENWIEIWRCVQEKLTGDLWPAVAAVACVLEGARSLQCLEAFEIAAAARGSAS